MLRDVLCGLDGLETWPCDEINPIWRHKNRDRGTDALMPSDATDEVIAYIRKAFEQQQRRVGSQVLVEKTCANTLRVPFVHAVFPHARFLCIVRDGREAALSAAERWTAPMDLTYTLRKLRYAPRSDVPALAMGWLRNRIRRIRDPRGALRTWGPVFEGLDEALVSRRLREVCGLQWSSCVTAAEAGLSGIDAAQVLKLRYEEFVLSPVESLHEILGWIGVEASDARVRTAVSTVSPAFGGRWPAEVPRGERHAFLESLRPGLTMLGY